MDLLEQKIYAMLNKILDIPNTIIINNNEDLLKYGLNSLATIKLILQLELEFEIEFSDEELLTENFNTLSKIMDQISNKFI